MATFRTQDVIFCALGALMRRDRTPHQDRARIHVQSIVEVLTHLQPQMINDVRAVISDLSRISEFWEDRWKRILKGIISQITASSSSSSSTTTTTTNSVSSSSSSSFSSSSLF